MSLDPQEQGIHFTAVPAAGTAKLPPGVPAAYAPVLRRLSARHGVDFLDYRLTTVGRRIERRMASQGVGSVDDYLRLLDGDAEELAALYQDLLIGVTEFFRDPEVWQHLAQSVLPEVFDEVGPGREFRAWVAATATGAEAYTVAMVLTEVAERIGRMPLIRLFATDLQPAALEIASRGVYPEEAVKGLAPERLARFFTRRSDGGYQVSSELRRMVVFTEHNLLSDPPFTRVDLITCRNVLIHLQPAAQQRVLKRLHFSLRAGGCLLLGASESPGALESAFAPAHARLRIYLRHRHLEDPRALGSRGTTSEAPRGLGAWRQAPQAPQAQAQRACNLLLEAYAPPALLVDAKGALLHTFGRVADFLRPALGRFSADVAEHVAPELRPALVTGLQRARHEEGPVRFDGLRVRLATGAERELRLCLRRMSRSGGDDAVLVTFEDVVPEVPQPPAATSALAGPAQAEESLALAAQVRRIEAELAHARAHLRATVEELEATNDALQASNEALLVSNEELQSANEELHSLNEELYTLNKDHEDKLEELEQLGDDMENLLHSTQIGTVFLDLQLRVRRFTPSASRHFNLIDQDVGRPISHLARNLEFDDFSEVVHRVLSTGESTQREVRHTDGGWYLVRLHPCRSEAGQISGVVLTFVDIRDLKVVSAHLTRRHADLQSFAHAVSHDLQQPVRAIVSFAELFHRRYGALAARQGGDAAVHLQQVRAGGLKLRAMFDRVLQYARVDARGERLQRVSLAEALNQALETLAVRLDSTGAKVSAGELPEVWADSTQLVWLLHELLDNALKFRAQDIPCIDVRALPGPEGIWRIEVSDNGIGIEHQDSEVVFEMFRRVHARDAVPGLGAGLALARRIIERHGGEIHAEPRAQGGTLVWFTVHGGDSIQSQPVAPEAGG